MDRTIQRSQSGHIFSIHDKGQAGTYLLRIQLSKDKQVQFGRFDGGRTISLEQGQYIYIGSALSDRGSTTLGNRIQRHADRTPPKTSHQIREDFHHFCDTIGIHYTDSPADKTPFWNIDHMTNLVDAEIIGIIMIREKDPLENAWSEFIESQPYTSVFAKGLGANDNEGHTHLQRADVTDKIWRGLPEILPLSPS